MSKVAVESRLNMILLNFYFFVNLLFLFLREYTPNKYSLIAKFDKLINRLYVNGVWTGHGYYHSHKHIYGFKEIKNLVENIGFEIVKLETFYLFYGIPIKTKSSLGVSTWILDRKQ